MLDIKRNREIYRFAIAMVLAALIPSSSACSSPEKPSSSGGGGFAVSGLRANLNNEQLTERAPIVLRGAVLSREVVALADDPYLPPGWELDRDERLMVEGGASHVKWQVAVDELLKGQVADLIWMVRLASSGDNIRLEGEADPFSLANVIGVDPSPNEKVLLWLEPDPWFGQNHFIVVRAADASVRLPSIEGGRGP